MHVSTRRPLGGVDVRMGVNPQHPRVWPRTEHTRQRPQCDRVVTAQGEHEFSLGRLGENGIGETMAACSHRQ